MGLLVGAAAQVFPVIITKPRIFIPIGALCMFLFTSQPCNDPFSGWSLVYKQATAANSQ